jgi:hypothetical protein
MYRDEAGRFSTIETPKIQIPEGWTVVKEHRGIITIRPLKDCRDHELACLGISREDDEAELRGYVKPVAGAE